MINISTFRTVRQRDHELNVTFFMNYNSKLMYNSKPSCSWNLILNLGLYVNLFVKPFFS